MKKFNLILVILSLLFCSCSKDEDVFATGSHNGHDYVDLGLSVKWATCNVGANKPQKYGDLYAWGETTTKTSYDWDTYKHCRGSYHFPTKYFCYSEFGEAVDNKTVLDPEDDAAHVNWGGSWRMPTDAEFDELLTLCTWTWTTKNGVNGYKVTSKLNDNSIFLPAAGQVWFSGDNSDYDFRGYYWSSYSGSSEYARCIAFSEFASGWAGDPESRCKGMSVRPVCP